MVTDILCRAWEEEKQEIDLSVFQGDYTRYVFDKEDICVVGVPSFGGRVPKAALDAVRQMKGGGAQAVPVAVYGNREYDDNPFPYGGSSVNKMRKRASIRGRSGELQCQIKHCCVPEFSGVQSAFFVNAVQFVLECILVKKQPAAGVPQRHVLLKVGRKKRYVLPIQRIQGFVEIFCPTSFIYGGEYQLQGKVVKDSIMPGSGGGDAFQRGGSRTAGIRQLKDRTAFSHGHFQLSVLGDRKLFQ